MNRPGVFRQAGACAAAALALALAAPAHAQEALPDELRSFLEADHKAADLDRDGVIGRAEVLATIERDFRDSDVNDDGVLTRADHPADIHPERLLRAELAYDANGDSVVTAAEYRDAMLRMARAMDRNGDDRISAEEMLAHHARLLSGEPMRQAQRDKKGGER